MIKIKNVSKSIEGKEIWKYQKWDWISFGYFAFPFTVHLVIKYLEINLINFLLLIFIGVVLFLLSNIIINKFSNKEKLIINTGIEFANELSEIELD